MKNMKIIRSKELAELKLSETKSANSVDSDDECTFDKS